MHNMDEQGNEPSCEAHRGADWATRAADLILENLKERKGVGDELDQVDEDVLLEIQETMAGIIRKASGAPPPAEPTEPEPEANEKVANKPDNRVHEAIQVFSSATFKPVDEFELKDAFVELIEGILAKNARQIYILAQPTGELEVRASIERKVHTLQTFPNHDALAALCATIVAAARDRVPYLPSRPFESIITRESIDRHGLRFPEQLETIHALIEPLTKGMFIDLRLQFAQANRQVAGSRK